MDEYGYVRVSSRDQNVDRQIAAMCDMGLDKNKLYIEWQSGKIEFMDVESSFFKMVCNDKFVTEKYYQLMDFWDVYKEFKDMLTKEERENRWLLQLVYEIDGMYQCIQNERRKRSMSSDELKYLHRLCKNIEGIYHSKDIKFLVKKKRGWCTLYEMPLDEFEERAVSFNYKAIENKIIEMLQKGGIIVVIAGAAGLTPQRLHSYLLGQRRWTVCPDYLVDSIKETALIDNKMARIRGSLRGIK